MTMLIMQYEPEVLQFIRGNQWSKVLCSLNEAWEKNKNDLNTTLCYGCGLWYVLVYDVFVYGCEFIASNQYDKVMNNHIKELSALTSIAFQKFKRNMDFLAIWGWMISVAPFYFFPIQSGETYQIAEQCGIKMIQIAHHVVPNNPVYTALYYATTDNEQMYKQAIKRMRTVWQHYFVEDDFVGTYFLNITTER